MTERLIDRVLALGNEVRAAAVYMNGQLRAGARAGLAGPSGEDSGRPEELIVNPTLLTLLRQRGDIDCGGLEYVVIRYGSFFQLVHPIPGGHLSVAIEPDADVPATVERVRSVIPGDRKARP
jgi:hypothetical protein